MSIIKRCFTNINFFRTGADCEAKDLYENCDNKQDYKKIVQLLNNPLFWTMLDLIGIKAVINGKNKDSLDINNDLRVLIENMANQLLIEENK